MAERGTEVVIAAATGVMGEETGIKDGEKGSDISSSLSHFSNWKKKADMTKCSYLFILSDSSQGVHYYSLSFAFCLISPNE